MSLVAILVAYVGYKIRLGDKVAKSPSLEGVLAAQTHSSPHLPLQKTCFKQKGGQGGPQKSLPGTILQLHGNGGE